MELMGFNPVEIGGGEERFGAPGIQWSPYPQFFRGKNSYELSFPQHMIWYFCWVYGASYNIYIYI